MANVDNPQIQIKIFTGLLELSLINEDIEVWIEKDLEPEPNEAEIRIHNLSPDNEQSIVAAGKESAPVEIHLTQWGTTSLMRAFAGEISTVKTRDLYPSPGMVTTIKATSQKINQRNYYVDEKVFPKGTPCSVIILFLAQAIGLPFVTGILPIDVTKYSYTVSGSAFAVLKAYLYDFGYYAYILDGVLYITDRFVPPLPTPIVLDPRLMFTNEPEYTTRSDNEEVAIRTVRLNKSGDVKKRIRNIKQQGPSTYILSSAQENEIEGRLYRFPVFPHVNPDLIISVGDELTRVQRTVVDADNLHDSSMWEMAIEADLYTGL